MISRKLEEGWDYRLDWRMAVVEERLLSAPQATSGQLCAQEDDLALRQAIRFEKGLHCSAAPAIRWAKNCHIGRSKHLAAAIVRAMVIAGCPREQIASKVGATPLSITYYEKFYFDVRRYLHQREWLSSIAIPSEPPAPFDPISTKTRMFLAAAFHHGLRGLERLMTGTIPKTADELDCLTREIRAAVTARAHEAMLGAMLTTAGSDDFARFVELGRLPAMQDRTRQDEKTYEFGLQMRRLIMRTAEAQVPPSQGSLQLSGGTHSAAPTSPPTFSRS